MPTVVIGHLYDYEVFENFEINKRIFIQEQKLKMKLEKMQTQLYSRQDVLSYYMDDMSIKREVDAFVNKKYQISNSKKNCAPQLKNLVHIIFCQIVLIHFS